MEIIEIRNEEKLEAWRIATDESFSQMYIGNANGTRWEVLCEDMRIFETVNEEVAGWCSWKWRKGIEKFWKYENRLIS